MNQLSLDSKCALFNRLKPFIAVIFLHLGLAGMDILSKLALNKGMSSYVYVVYRHAFATIVIAPFAIVLEKKRRPKMTFPIFVKIIVLSLLVPVIGQNLYFLGMKHTSATAAAALSNIVPAIAFLMAWLCRLEKVNLKSIYSHAKIVGTVATVAGAMIMTLVRGPIFGFPWTEGKSGHENQSSGLDLQHSIKGGLMIISGCCGWASFTILQAITLRTYPAELSLTAWICLLGTGEGAIVALVMEWGNYAVWSINWDAKLFAALYTGIICSGVAYYIQGVIMQERGPVFVTAFSPLAMVIVAIMSCFILGEQMVLGRVLGAIIIVAGLYLVVWGKSKDYETPSIDEQASSAKQMVNKENEANGSIYHECINVNASVNVIATKHEQV